MILSKKMVSNYIDLPKDLDIKDIAEAMTNVGNEYDSANPLINCTNLIIGEVLECEMHPDSDHLHVCKVNIGKEVLNIVCGAPNVRKGIKVIVALDGAKLPGGEIKKGMIRGCESNGMICSLQELGLDNKFLKEEDKTGIHEFPSSAVVGEDPIKELGLDDEVIDFELTSNRGDLLSMLGMAYELGAIYNKEVKEPSLEHNEIEESIKGKFEVEVKTEDCPLFLARKVLNVEIKESPAFIKNALIACGIRPINNVVDISNYVMLELGQPLHFYDADKLGNKIIVRNAEDKEILTTLDDIERELNSEDIVIANEKEAVGIAGIMGGESTEVTNDTKNILVEAAIFDNIKIRKTSKKIVRSEASNRFEKGLDYNRTYMAMERAVKLLEEYANGKILKDTIIHDNLKKEDKVIEVSLDKIEKVLGIEISKEEVLNIFKGLGFDTLENNNIFTVKVPSRRLDIAIKEDLIEEVGRIYGMDKIPSKLPNFDAKLSVFNRTNRSIKHFLMDKGLNETVSYSLISKNDVYKYTTDTFESVELDHPMSEDRSTLRYSLLSSLKSIYDYNDARKNSDISIFEMGKSFYKKDSEYLEKNKLAILMSGVYELGIHKEKVDFYLIKGLIEDLLDYLGFVGRYSFEAKSIPSELHPYQSANIIVQGKNLGVIGKLHPSMSKKDIYVAELEIEELLKLHPAKMSYREIPKFPSVSKDIAFIVDNNITNEELKKSIKNAGGKLLVDIDLFDIYTGDAIGENKKSLAYNLTFSDPTKTLTEEEVMELFNNIIKEVTNKHKAVLRDK